MLKFIFKIAFRNMLRQRRRSFLTLFLISIAYILISLQLSITEGTYGLIIRKFTSHFTGHARVQRTNFHESPSLFKTINNPNTVYQNLERQSSIENYAPRVLGSCLSYSAKKNSPTQVIGVDLEKEKTTTNFSHNLPKNFNFTPQNNLSPVVLSKSLQKRLKLKIGDELILIGSGYDGSIANDRFLVKAVLEEEELIGPWFVLMDIKKSQEFFSLENNIHQIILAGKNPESTTVIKNNLNHLTKISPDVQTISWQEMSPEFYKSMLADKEGGQVSLVIVCLLAILTVFNTILMTVLERIPEFGLLKAIGTRTKQITQLIFAEVFILASFGCLLGTSLGFFINLWFAKVGIKFDTSFNVGGMTLERITGEISFFTLAAPSLVIILSCLVAAIYPAYKAISQDPVTSLRS